MSLSRYNPRDLASIQDEFERMFRSFFGGSTGTESAPTTAGAWSPALDVEETEEAFVLHVELPGCQPEDVEVNLEENVLTVTGERRFYDEREAEGFRRIERRFGRFHRAVRLPDRVATDRVDASFENGLLTITVPKAEEAKPRRIQIRARSGGEDRAGEDSYLPRGADEVQGAGDRGEQLS
ncbi:MAG: Hsp20/alpha crystallin family protein [Actinomycetota bacterium]|nr:Hsp20/alpha crystallin family protein [Actinomycetota bacterium]